MFSSNNLQNFVVKYPASSEKLQFLSGDVFSHTLYTSALFPTLTVFERAVVFSVPSVS